MSTNSLVVLENENVEIYKKSVFDFLRTASGSAFNICAQMYSIILMSEKEDHPFLFEAAVNLFEDVDSDESEDVLISQYEEQLESLKEVYGDLVNSFIDFFVQQKYREHEFYSNMWTVLQNDIFFPDDAAKVFAFYYVVIDRRIPYYEIIDGYQMSNEAYRVLRQRHRAIAKKIRYILYTEISQKTERASILLNELGITIPESDASSDVINEYEKNLIIVTSILDEIKSRESSNIGTFLEQMKSRLFD